MQQTIAQLGAGDWIAIGGIIVTVVIALLGSITAAIVWVGRLLMGIRDELGALRSDSTHARERLDEQCERLTRIEHHVFQPAPGLKGARS